MCCSTVPSRDSKMFLSPTERRNHTFQFHSIKIHRHTQKDNLNSCILLFILAFSSSVRCSVLVLMTTFTLFTLKTWGNNQNPPSYFPIDGLHIFLWHDTLAPVKKKMSNFCEPLLQIRWQLQFCHFSSPKSQTCSCETESSITDSLMFSPSVWTTSSAHNTEIQIPDKNSVDAFRAAALITWIKWSNH